LHQLSGSAGAYGYDAMGEMARELEKRCVQWLNLAPAARCPGRELQRELAPLAAMLIAALRAAALPAEGAPG
jgi:HPt (histidine-containing phosphotransfer) domain-containing protein